MTDRVPLFCGGIGDVFLQCCTTDRYRILSGPECPEIVVNASRNEYAGEFFIWHPNAREFRVVTKTQPVWEQQSKQDFYRSLGLPVESLYEGGKTRQIDWGTPFFPAPRDEDFLASGKGCRFGLFAPFSKDQKTVPVEICQTVLPALHERLRGQVELFGCARGYQTVNRRIQDLRPYATAGWLVDLSSQELSVPGTIELARQAEFYVGANSCLALVTMSMGKPTVIFEPAAHTNPNFWSRLFDVDRCLLIQKFDAFSKDAVLGFLTDRLPLHV